MIAGFYMDGRWVEANKACVPATDRGFLFGEAVFETMRTWNGKPFALSLHLERLKNSARAIGLDLPLSIPELRKILESFLENVGGDVSRINYRFRIILTTGDGKKPALYVHAEPFSMPSWIYEEGVRVGISKFRRIPVESCPPAIKFLSRPDILLSRFSKDDFYDLIMLNTHGNVVEGTFSNVFFVIDGRLVTPGIESGILPGITRMVVLNMAKRLELPVEERPVELWEVYSASEMFLTHTSGGIVPVKRFLDKLYISTSVNGLTRLLMDNLGDEISSNDMYWL
ncbi:MAG: branched-chain amino acid aminotransferase [Thermotogota bacterium]|nr:branched-chain amino acid aminotransferase [Thermotogota bacterium]MDK2864638.1 branched-chain amino acid aminotransferase [Thermotogota bacterium]